MLEPGGGPGFATAPATEAIPPLPRHQDVGGRTAVPAARGPLHVYCDLTTTLAFRVGEVETVETESVHMLTIDLPYVPGGEDLSLSLIQRRRY